MATEEMASVAEEPRGRSISPAVQRGDQRVGHARRILVVAAVARALSAHGAPAFPAGEPGAAAGVQVPAAYGQLPVAFEANRGQTDPAVRFLARGRGQTLFLTPTEAVLVLATPARGRGDTAPPAPARGAVVRMAAVGASPAPTIVGEEALPGTANYFRGKDPAQWHRGVPTYAKVRYRDLYPGIDLVYYGRQSLLETDFVVAPGADPGQIGLRLAGAERLKVDGRGDVVLRTAGGALRLRKPIIYQDVDGGRRAVAGRWVRRGPE